MVRFTGSLAAEHDQNPGEQSAAEVGDQVLAGIVVTTDVGFGNVDDGNVFDDFIHRSQPHASEDAQGNHADRGKELSAQTMMNAGAKGLPDEPSGRAKSEAVNEVVVFDGLVDDPPGIENLILAMIRPTVGESHEPAGQMHRSPDRHAPKKGAGEIYPLMHHGNDDREDPDKRDVDFEEFPILLDNGCADGGHHVKDHHEDDRFRQLGFPHK